MLVAVLFAAFGVFALAFPEKAWQMLRLKRDGEDMNGAPSAAALLIIRITGIAAIVIAVFFAAVMLKH